MAPRRLTPFVLAATLAGCSPERPAASPARTTTPRPRADAARPGPPAVAEAAGRGAPASGGGDRPLALPRDGAPRAETTDRDALRLLALSLQDQAGRLERPHNSPLFLRSAAVMRKLRADFPGPTDEENRVAALVFYNEACTLALAGESARALRALAEACDCGFDQAGTLDGDPEVDSLRGSPEFAGLQKCVERRFAETLVARTRPFPFDFRLKDADQAPVAAADFKGKVTVVNLWGTWCIPCRKTLPHLVDLSRRYEKKGVRVVGINYENEQGGPARDRVRSFVKEAGIPYPCLIGDEATQRQVPNFAGFPTTLFLDREGKVRAVVTGYEPIAAIEAIVAVIGGEVPSPAAPTKPATSHADAAEAQGP